METDSGHETWKQVRGVPNALSDDWKQATGRGVSVAIVDSGVDASHPELQDRIGSQYEAFKEGQRVIFRESASGDSAGHGTACAGIIAKIAPNAVLHSIKVLGSAGIGDGSSFLAGLEFAINQGSNVINLSLGTTKTQFAAPLRDLLDRAYMKGCIVVAAANNLPQPSFPSVFPSSLIAVNKHSGDDPLEFGFRFGKVIELTAPGVNIKAPWPGGTYKTITGNSFACPHISAILALFLEKHPGLTPFQAKAALFQAAGAAEDRV